ncbi:MAG: hypothetical protein NC098_08895 [Lachnoclostridium sp.]|nr:hypothetical protein [Lachnoclostridium sp.]
MKIYNLIISFAFLSTLLSCSENDNPIQTDETIRSRSENIDIRDFGELHNMMLDNAVTFLSLNPYFHAGDFNNNSQLQHFHKGLTTLVVENYPKWMQSTNEEIEESMQQFSFIYDCPDLSKLYLSNARGTFTTTPFTEECFAYLDNECQISGKEIAFLKEIVTMAELEDGSYVTANALRDSINDLVNRWETIYGVNAYGRISDTYILSGVCVSIAKSSLDWWSKYLSKETGRPVRIAPILAYFVEKDLKGAALGIICSVLVGQRDPKAIAKDALIAGGVSSIYALF